MMILVMIVILTIIKQTMMETDEDHDIKKQMKMKDHQKQTRMIIILKKQMKEHQLRCTKLL